jgi:hypothetical protein
MSEKVYRGVVSLRFLNEGKAYIVAAETLIRESQVELPTYFLLSHALELTLKAYLVARGVEEKELRCIRHDLQRAYRRAVALGLRTDNQHVPALVQAISEFHEKHVFRYPVINNADESVVIRTLVKAEDVLEIVSAIWRRVEGDAIRARLDAANKGGQHPVEYWDMGGSSSAT